MSIISRSFSALGKLAVVGALLLAFAREQEVFEVVRRAHITVRSNVAPLGFFARLRMTIQEAFLPPSLDLHDAALDGFDQGLGAVGDAEFAKDVRDMDLHRALDHAEVRADLLVAESMRSPTRTATSGGMYCSPRCTTRIASSRRSSGISLSTKPAAPAFIAW